MNRFWSKSLVTLTASGLFAAMAQADLAEFNAINAAARAARVRGRSGRVSHSLGLKFESIGCAQDAGLDQSVVPEGRAGLGTMRTVAG